MKKILLIDDSPIILATAEHALTQAGYEVATRTSFDELMSQSMEGFDLILMDVEMPELFGDDVAAVLRHERGVKTPIYLFSTIDAAELAQRAHEAQVDGFIDKSRGIDHVLEQVRSILG